MNEALAPPELSPRLELSRRLALIMGALREVIAAHAGRDRSAVAMVLLLWPYLGRLVRRFEALVRRVEAGDGAARTRAALLAPRVRLPFFGPPRPQQPGLPGSFAWLMRLVPGARQLGGQVRHLMAGPEMAALLAAAPQAVRILRPLCRMFGIVQDPDLPPALFGRPARRRLSTAPDACGATLTPALSPKREREKQVRESETYWPVPDHWSTLPETSPRRRARRRLPAFRAAPA